ncbi:protein far1-related sequence 11-like [Gigaspora margarita]|uniref:Protein far1-related sequence 11-like n=1 Tax=Gigaspora margarita TaxID=4874 RepID=A0A8H4AGD6_GIGMA|nr:protein far1-related sequence 11-like [Gigaspora margarita]
MSIKSEPAILTIVNEQFGSFKHNLNVNFVHFDDICGSYIFTNKVRNLMSLKKRWGEEFGIMKKTLDLVIAMGKYNELYEIHLNFSKEMEMELIMNSGHNILDNDDPVEFATTINNPIVTSSKVRRPKNAKATINNNTSQINHSETINVQRDELTNLENISQENISHNCSVCGKAGHNARTCNMDNTSQDDYRVKNSNAISMMNTFRCCSVYGQAGYNIWTCGLDSSYSDHDNDNLILLVARHNVYNNPNYDNKFCRCGVYGQTGHNFCTYSVKA